MSTRRALAFSFLDRYSALLLSIVASMAVARLLTPAELGVFSVSMVFIMFISAMRDLGAGQYLVQEKELTPDRISATWTVLVGTGALMAVIVLAAAYPVAAFFHEPRMVPIMWVISLNFAVNPLGSMTYAWLMREMRFDALAMMRFSASVAGSITSVLLAWRGFGPISLAWGNLASTLVNAAVSLRFRPAHFGWRLGTKDLRRVVSFGGRISATSVVLNIGAGAPEFMLGKLQNLSAAGLYSRGNGLAAMFQKLVLDATVTVAMPLLAKEHRESGRIGEPLVRALTYVTALGWSFFAGIALLGYPLVRLLYGWQWDQSVPLMRWLALGMSIGLPAALCPQALTAIGRAGQILRASLTVLVIQVLCIGAGASHSLQGAGIGFCAAQCLALPVWARICARQFEVPWAALVRGLLRSIGVAAFTSLAPLAILLWVGDRPDRNLAAVIGAGGAGLAAFVLAVHLFKHPIGEELAWLAGKLPWRRTKQES
ncbi:lipopolysaccharide biosynthesis protein [Pelomonas sp. KK5]|uniref:lipopolysaccharide biosynthesis protein n=1 Tax=Pelomonas sp. KK5 TaxID=1855730 RepID=UPI00097C72CD|nr:lipopolysaccharide biosynthesis protein [Pelomonas sp. KK5]